MSDPKTEGATQTPADAAGQEMGGGRFSERPADLMQAIHMASERHILYRDLQERIASDSLGDRTPGAARRAAQAIRAYMATGHLSVCDQGEEILDTADLSRSAR